MSRQVHVELGSGLCFRGAPCTTLQYDENSLSCETLTTFTKLLHPKLQQIPMLNQHDSQFGKFTIIDLK
jgi:hypothetical protein